MIEKQYRYKRAILYIIKLYKLLFTTKLNKAINNELYSSFNISIKVSFIFFFLDNLPLYIITPILVNKFDKTKILQKTKKIKK